MSSDKQNVRSHMEQQSKEYHSADAPTHQCDVESECRIQDDWEEYVDKVWHAELYRKRRVSAFPIPNSSSTEVLPEALLRC